MKKAAFLFLFLLVLVAGIDRVLSRSAPKSKARPLQEDTCSGRYTKISFLSNIHIPTDVMIHSFQGNEKTVKELYDIVDYINRSEGLKDSRGYDQRISFTVFLDRKANNRDFMKVFSGLQMMNKKGLRKTPLTIQYTESQDAVWLQDHLEFGVITLSNNKTAYAVCDVNYNSPFKSIDIPELISRRYRMAFLKLNGQGVDSSDAGDAGGNIETTPEGKIYVGSRITDALYRDLRAKTGQDIIKLPTSWLFVGHIDEIIFFMPSESECGSTAVYADPLEALNLIVKGKSWTSPELNAVKESFVYYLKDPSLEKDYYQIEDFVLTRPLRKTGDADEMIYGKYSDWFVSKNLQAYLEIQKAVEILKGTMKCQSRFVSLPVVFREPWGEVYYDCEGLSMVNPLTNALVLRDHVIIPRGHFSEIAVSRLKSSLKKNVHLIDAKWYEENHGSIHCATNVIRNSRFRVKMQTKKALIKQNSPRRRVRIKVKQKLVSMNTDNSLRA